MADSPPRQNSRGSLCPPWCVIDHESDAGGGHRYIFHGSETTRIDVPVKPGQPDGRIWVRAIHGGYGDDQPQVDVAAPGPGAGGPDLHAWIAPREAEGLAAVIGMLAKAPPEAHRELAAAIRKAAADIAGEAREDGADDPPPA